MRFGLRGGVFGLLVLLSLSAASGVETSFGPDVEPSVEPVVEPVVEPTVEPRPTPVAASSGASPVLIDRIVALVDDDPILLSDVERAIGLGLLGGRSGVDARAERRRILDLLVEQRLRYHEIERYSFQDVSVQAIEEQVERLRTRFPDDASFTRRLAELGLDGSQLRELLARQLLTLAYVEERLGPRVFVGLDEIRAYYETSLVPELHARGETPPPLESVREQIRSLLKELRLNEEIERWTTELRRQADVTDTLDEEPALPLPPHLPVHQP
jgi:hypothetical protein